MTQSSFFERVVGALFGGGQSDGNKDADFQLVADTIEAVVDMVEPRIRLNAGYRGKLEGGIRATIAYMREVSREGLDPILLARPAWNDDPCLNAVFARADDVPACLGGSKELRAFFDAPANREVQEAYALLVMKREERTVFAPRFQGDKLEQDIAQVTVSFSGHKVIAPAASLADTRREVGKRIMNRLAQIALSRIIALDTKATELAQHKGFLAARMRLLNLARDGMEGIVKDPATIREQMKEVEREMKNTVEGYIDAKSSLATLDGYIRQVDEVFSHPDRHLALTHTPLRINRMGFKSDDASSGPVNDLNLVEMSIGENLQIAIAIVRCPRSELPPREDLLANAERYL